MIGYERCLLERLSQSQAGMRRGSPLCEKLRGWILKQFKNNISQSTIASNVGISPSTIHNTVKRLRGSREISAHKGQSCKPTLNADPSGICDGMGFVTMAWVASTSVKAPLMLKVKTGFGATYAAIQTKNFFRDIPAHSSKTMSSHILHLLQRRGFVLKSAGTRLACLQYRSVFHWKCVAHYKAQHTRMETPDCWATKVVYQARMGNNFTFRTSTISVLSTQTLTECCSKKRWCNTGVNMPLYQVFWNMFKASNSELMYILKNQQSLSVWTLNILSLYCIQLNISRKWFANHCILFIFTFTQCPIFFGIGSYFVFFWWW